MEKRQVVTRRAHGSAPNLAAKRRTCAHARRGDNLSCNFGDKRRRLLRSPRGRERWYDRYRPDEKGTKAFNSRVKSERRVEGERQRSPSRLLGAYSFPRSARFMLIA